MRLIDADALMPNAELKGVNCIVTAYDIAKAPTIDAVPVIRCKDCLMHGVCRFELGLGLDGYCSQAKRKES